MKDWNLIVEKEPLEGSLNMARDEFLFRSLGQAPQTAVRFYQWERPTVSLGYSQPVEEVVDLEFCRQQGIDVVRRITGGKLVLHHREVTYSVCSSDTKIFSATLAESYRLISSALIRGLQKMGLEARLAGPTPTSYRKGRMPCFSSPARDEIEIGGKKIVGSAQKRIGTRFLQHGSIPLEADGEMLRKLWPQRDKEARLQMTSLSEALGKTVSFAWAVEQLASGMAEFFGIRFRPKIFQPEEVEAIRRIQKVKYETEAWTLGREAGRRLDFFDSR